MNSIMCYMLPQTNVWGREAREKNSTGIYHIMLRGIDKRNIFLRSSDYQKFKDYISKAKEKSDFRVYAYCSMTNHVHMLLKTETEEIGDIVRRIAVGYVQYHNMQNGRVGHLFQNRFKSEVVESDEYFLTVLRYIHQNPIKAKIVDNIESYKWSSYDEYINEDKLIDSKFPLSLFSNIKEFEIYMKEKNKDKCLEYNEKKRYTDEELTEIIISLFDIEKLHKSDIVSRNKMLKRIKEHTGASNRQLSRALNIGRGILDRIK